MRLSQVFSTAALAGCALALSAPTAGLADEKEGEDAAEAEEMTKGEKRLAKLLEGREAGKPVNCIRYHTNNRVQIIDDTALVYGRGKTIYVNYTRDPSDIDDREVLVTRRYGSQFCRSDIVRKVDNMSGIYAGNVFLTKFVPYTRKES